MQKNVRKDKQTVGFRSRSGRRVDTIAAIATASGIGGVAIIRVSGPLVRQIITEILNSKLKPRYAHFLDFLDDNQKAIDKGVALFFPTPKR